MEDLKSALRVESVKEFAKSKGFTQLVPTVRVNEHGYPFVTFIDANNKAENVYFSRAAAKAVPAGTVVDKAMLEKYQIGYTTNSEGHERIKLISNSTRLDITELFD